MNSDALKPCPFCGGIAKFDVVDAELQESNETHPESGGEFIVCTNGACAASTCLVFPTMTDAKPFLIERWNRRPAPQVNEREAFEAWYQRKFKVDADDGIFDRNPFGDYENQFPHDLWTAWQARAASAGREEQDGMVLTPEELHAINVVNSLPEEK